MSTNVRENCFPGIRAHSGQHPLQCCLSPNWAVKVLQSKAKVVMTFLETKLERGGELWKRLSSVRPSAELQGLGCGEMRAISVSKEIAAL